MITRVEIDGFKTFDKFVLDLRPFSAIVGPNASGKSNLFDAMRFLSLLAQVDVRSAMQDLRGEPEELFRRTPTGTTPTMKFAVEVLLDAGGIDAFGTTYELRTRRLRYELNLSLRFGPRNNPQGIYVTHERCAAISRKEDTATFISRSLLGSSGRKTPFISMLVEQGHAIAIEIRQDGPTEGGKSKRGRPVTLPAPEASRTALSTISTAEFPHLYALRHLLSSLRFLEINPTAARRPSDRFESKVLHPDASNLAAVLAHLRDVTSSSERPDGSINDISIDLATLIPSVKKVEVFDEVKDYSFGVKTSDGLQFSSRVISDGTLRLLALLAVINDPDRTGILCFEEPENGVHEGRIDTLIDLLRRASFIDEDASDPLFQVLINTHSPAVLQALQDEEIVAADVVASIDPDSMTRETKTRMRNGVQTGLELDPARHLTRAEVNRLLRRPSGQA